MPGYAMGKELRWCPLEGQEGRRRRESSNTRHVVGGMVRSWPNCGSSKVEFRRSASALPRGSSCCYCCCCCSCCSLRGTEPNRARRNTDRGALIQPRSRSTTAATSPRARACSDARPLSAATPAQFLGRRLSHARASVRWPTKPVPSARCTTSVIAIAQPLPVPHVRFPPPALAPELRLP